MPGENPNNADSPSPEQVEAALSAGAPQSVPPTVEAAAAAVQPDPVASSEANAPSTATGVAADAASAPVAADSTCDQVGTVPLDLPDFVSPLARDSDRGIELLSDVELDVKIELGRAMMLIEDVLKLGEGSVVELDKLAGDPVDVFVNDRLVARGEVLVMNDNFCVRVSEIVAGQESAEEAA